MKQIIVMIVLTAIVLSGCNGEQDDRADTTTGISSMQTSGEETSGMEGGESKEEESFDFKYQSVSYDVYDTTWEQETCNYTGEDMEITYEISSMPVQAEFSFLVYIDGILTPYYSSADASLSNRQVFKTQKDGQKGQYTIYFKPLYGEYGKTCDLTVVLLDNPNYMLTDTSYVSFGLNHSIMEVSKKKIKFQAETIANKDISSEYEVKNLTGQVESRFANDYAEGGNNLNESMYCAMNIKSLYDEADEEENKGYFSVNKKDNLELYIPFLGKEGEYVVSLYINYELQPVFDGKHYLDVQVQRDLYTEKRIELDLSNYSGLNHIELVAVDRNGGGVIKEGPILLEIKE